MSAVLFYLPFPTAFTANGYVAPGARASFYLAGTNIFANVYSDDTLTTEHTNPVVADGAGRFPDIYLDNSQTLRVDIRDKNGVLLTSVDPYIPGTIAGQVIGTGGAIVADRTELATVVGTAGTPVSITETGREGTFFWDASDLSTEVAADVYQGIYVAPTSDTTGASGAWVRSLDDGPIQARWFGFEDGATENAARLESISATANAINGRMACVQLPRGKVTMDAGVNIDYPVQLIGHGHGLSKVTAGTNLDFPAGSNGLNFRNGTEAGNSIGGYGSIVENIWFSQVGAVGTSGTCTYNGATAITLSTLLDTSNGQMILVEGASTSVQLPDRTFATTNGSTTVTPTITPTDFLGGTPYFGNRIGYPGMVVSGSGIPAGTTIATLGLSSNFTLSANATATASGVAVSIVPPILARILSGGGTASLTVDDPTYGASVSSRRIRHCPAAIYITTGRATVRNCFFDFGSEGAGVVIRGHTTDGSVSDSCKFYNCTFNCKDFNVVVQGSDAQVHGFYGCKFDGALMHVLDNSEFGNTFVDCEWAYNVGILVVQITAQTKLYGGYFESGTSWIGPIQGLCSAYDVVSMVDGSGFAVARAQGGDRIMGPLVAESLDAFNGAVFRGSAHPVFIGTPISGTAISSSLSGVVCLGLGQAGAGFGCWITSNAQPGGAYEKLHIEATQIVFSSTFNGSDMATLKTTGIELPASSTLKIAGTQVVGSRITGWTAATGTPSRGAFAAAAAGTASGTYTQSELQGALNRIAALEARLVGYDADLRTHGLIGT